MQIDPQGAIFAAVMLTLITLGMYFGLLPALGWAVNKELVLMDKLPAKKEVELLHRLRRYYNIRLIFQMMSCGVGLAAIPLLIMNLDIPPLGFIIGSVLVVIGLLGITTVQFVAVKRGLGRYFDEALIFMTFKDAGRFRKAAWRVAKRRRQRFFSKKR